MAYSVIGGDGKEYGPVELAELQSWLNEGRVTPHSQVKDFMSGRVMPLSQVPGLIQAPVAPPIPGAVPSFARPGMSMPTTNVMQESNAPLIGICLRCALALGIFFFFSGGGYITAAYSLYYAVMLTVQKNRWGTIALVIAIATCATIGICASMGLGGHLIRRHNVPVESTQGN